MRARARWCGCPVAVVIAAAALLPATAVAADPVTFSATGAAQTFTVPPGVTSITATVGGAARGALGPGATGDFAGRNGGQTKATLLVAPGSVLTLVVGKQGNSGGASPSVAYGGGGAAGGSGSRGGGGGSFVFGPTGVLLLAAGGGGGWGDINWGGKGAGAGTVGQKGLPDGGGPGTETAGGTPGSTGGTAGGGPATIASFATTGGAGGSATGGGGGGGYFGGGGGGGPDGFWGGHGGGGGSGYASANTALVTGASGSVGTQAGDGQITFVPNEGPVPPPAPVECANGIDDDHDGFKDAGDPQCKLNRGAEGPVDNPLGRVTGSRRKRPVVGLLGRTGGCNNRTFVVVGRARLRLDGRFRVTAKPFPGLAIAIYRARTAIPGGRTFTLPQAVKLR